MICCIVVKTILVTGGTGLIGNALAKVLKTRGYRLILLSRGTELPPDYDAVFQWDAINKQFDYAALDGVTDVIHLAGAGIADKRWTAERKKEIIESRVAPLQAIRAALLARNQKLNALVSGSAVGWYGSGNDSILHTEKEPAANDFMGETCKLWEKAAKNFSDCADRVVTVRTGVVLDTTGGALPVLMRPVKLCLGAPLGNGLQEFPWIHADDIVMVYINALENPKYEGPINATATENCSNKMFTKTLCSVLDRPFWPVGVPSFFMKMLFGEMAAAVLGGSRISNEKLRTLGFRFKHPELAEALTNLLKNKPRPTEAEPGLYPVKPTNRG